MKNSILILLSIYLDLLCMSTNYANMLSRNTHDIGEYCRLNSDIVLVLRLHGNFEVDVLHKSLDITTYVRESLLENCSPAYIHRT